MRQAYLNQVELLLRCLPQVEKEDSLAIKGGTALNLFVLDMPRLSVDIDLTYLPIASRDESLAAIADAMHRIKSGIESTIPDTQIQVATAKDIPVARLIVRRGDAHIKLEPNTVLRGSVFEPISMELCSSAQNRFELSATAVVLSRGDLYGGKICAALDRQHPRDLFDVKLLLDSNGFDDNVRRAFVVYLASHSRPMHELLAPTLNDIRPTYENSFAGMMDSPPPVEALELARAKLIELVNTTLTTGERDFLLAIKRGKPHWDLLGIPNIERLPGLQWKLLNIQRMETAKHANAVAALEKVLLR